jgi:hypothetical protein
MARVALPTEPPSPSLVARVMRPREPWDMRFAMGYLSVPESRDDNESPWAVLGRELLRSALKAGGHTLAHFMDNEPLKRGK